MDNSVDKKSTNFFATKSREYFLKSTVSTCLSQSGKLTDATLDKLSDITSFVQRKHSMKASNFLLKKESFLGLSA